MRVAVNIVTWALYALLIFPVIVVIGAAISSGDYLQFPPAGLSLRWFGAMWNDTEMMEGFAISAQLAAATVLLCVPLGALGAIAIHTMPPGPKNVSAAAALSPLSVPMVLTGFALLAFLTQAGTLNFVGLLVGHTIICVPYVLRTALSSLALSDPSLPRAAEIHGARPWQVTWHAILPTMRPGLISGGLFVLLSSFNNVVISAFIAPPGNAPLPVVLFTRMDNLAEPSVAAASVVTIVLTALLCLVLEWRFSLFKSLGAR